MSNRTTANRSAIGKTSTLQSVTLAAEKANAADSFPRQKHIGTAITYAHFRNSEYCPVPHPCPALEPTKFVRRFGPLMVPAAAGYPILDVACGSGRNGVFMAELGAPVIGVDR